MYNLIHCCSFTPIKLKEGQEILIDENESQTHHLNCVIISAACDERRVTDMEVENRKHPSGLNCVKYHSDTGKVLLGQILSYDSLSGHN